VRFADIFRIALAAVVQHKLRNILTTLGVVIGTFVLVLSLSIGWGVDAAVKHEFTKHDQLRRIQVWPAYEANEDEMPPEKKEVKGKMSDEKRERIRETLVRQWSQQHARKPKLPLTADRLKTLREIDHVHAVIPHIQRAGLLTLNGKTENTLCFGAEMEEKGIHQRLILGDYLPSEHARCVLISEFLLYRMGIVDDDDVNRVLGERIRLEQYSVWRPSPNLLLTLMNVGQTELTPEESSALRKVVDKLPDAVPKIEGLTDEERRVLNKALKKQPPGSKPVRDVPVSEEFTIVGVIREFTKDDMENMWGLERMARDADVILPLGTAEELAFRSPYSAEHGVDGVTVVVDEEKNLKAVNQEIKDMGLNANSLLEFYETVRRNILLFGYATDFIAVIALLVAALGITNTMLMSILERTHEIGVMKAVGAREQHIQFLFLVEGALIGVVGGSLGLFFGWLASFPGDAIARHLMEKQTGSPAEVSVFAFPLWLTLGAPLFACLMSTLAAVYPARRAAKVNPITALRHE
jgi:putative ABC transport system permease protein